MRIYRNKAKNIEQLKEHRAHYINKMLPLIRRFQEDEQKIIICSNSMQATSRYLKEGHPVKFIVELKRYMSQWEPRCGYLTIFRVALMKLGRRI